MSNNFNEAIHNHNLTAVMEVHGIPDKYKDWVRGRQLRSCMMYLSGDVIRSMDTPDESFSKVVESSRLVQSDFLQALHSAKDFQSKSNTLNRPMLFPYRRVEDLPDDLCILANSELYERVDKEIIHKPYTKEVDFSDRPTLNGIPVLRGAVVGEKMEGDYNFQVKDTVNKLNRAGTRALRKPSKGTDGNGIVLIDNELTDEYIDQIIDSQSSFIIEEEIPQENLLGSVSVQFAGEVLGVLTERPKYKTLQWRGNTTGVDLDIPDDEKRSIEESVKIYTDLFKEYLGSFIGEDPEIMGLDFLVFEEDYEIKVVLVDPNIRMPGNMFMYTDKLLLEEAGFQVGEMESILLYNGEIMDGSAVELNQYFNMKEISLIEYDEEEVVGIRTDEDGYPYGVIPVVQDEDGLTMFNIIGRDKKQIKMIKDIMFAAD